MFYLTTYSTTAFVTPVVEHWLEREIALWVHHEGSIPQSIAPWANALATELHLAPLITNTKSIYYTNKESRFQQFKKPPKTPNQQLWNTHIKFVKPTVLVR